MGVFEETISSPFHVWVLTGKDVPWNLTIVLWAGALMGRFQYIYLCFYVET
jgi:hypothetical protein